MQVKEIDINTGKIKGHEICKKIKYKISFLGGRTTPTYSIFFALLWLYRVSRRIGAVGELGTFIQRIGTTLF